MTHRPIVRLACGLIVGAAPSALGLAASLVQETAGEAGGEVGTRGLAAASLDGRPDRPAWAAG